ncbi:hypothetical protein D3C79_973600 [compost metagenome]
MADGAFYQRYRFIDIKGFGQIIERPLLVGADGGVQIRMRGHYDDRQHWVALFDLLE